MYCRRSPARAHPHHHARSSLGQTRIAARANMTEHGIIAHANRRPTFCVSEHPEGRRMCSHKRAGATGARLRTCCAQTGGCASESDRTRRLRSRKPLTRILCDRTSRRSTCALTQSERVALLGSTATKDCQAVGLRRAVDNRYRLKGSVKVSHWFGSPVLKPTLNQRIRCSPEP